MVREKDIAAVVCARVLPDREEFFKDNEYGECSVCNHAIMFRPTVPKTPPKVCEVCIVNFTQTLN